MKIAQLVSNLYSIPPRSLRAIYHLAGLLTDGLVEGRHDVTLFNVKNAQTLAKLDYVTDIAVSKMPGLSELAKRRYMQLLASKCYQRASEFDIIHSHFNLVGCYYAPLVKTPSVHTIHSPIAPDMMPIMENVARNNFISISLNQRKQMPKLNWIANIYHGVDTNHYTFNPNPEDYLLFLGRVTGQKGVHFAIEAAKATNSKLIISGKSYVSENYWHKEVEPHIDGVNIRYVGESDHNKKIEYLRNAKALLFPTHEQDPFGLVTIEAMACGTPVIGFDVAAVPEIVQDKKTGYLVKDVAGMVKAINKIEKIQRAACRERVEKFFSIEKMVKGYEKVYERVIEDAKHANRKKKTARAESNRIKKFLKEKILRAK
jgi:glycosyltransferase involved in cell wall biosynthesis